MLPDQIQLKHQLAREAMDACEAAITRADLTAALEYADEATRYLKDSVGLLENEILELKERVEKQTKTQ